MMQGEGQTLERAPTSTGASPSRADFFCRWPEISGLAKNNAAEQQVMPLRGMWPIVECGENTSISNGLLASLPMLPGARQIAASKLAGSGNYFCQHNPSEVRHGYQHPTLDVIGLLRGFKAFGEASRSLPGAPKRKQEQEHCQRDGSVAQRRPHPWARGDPGEEPADHRRPRFQSSSRA